MAEQDEKVQRITRRVAERIASDYDKRTGNTTSVIEHTRPDGTTEIRYVIRSKSGAQIVLSAIGSVEE